MAKSVNCWIIEAAIGRLMVAEAKHGSPFDLDDEEVSKSLFREHIVPFVRSWSAASQKKLKLSLAYFMDRRDVLEDHVLASLQDLSVVASLDTCEFFRWLWETLYPGEDYRSVDLQDVVENNDEMEL